ncbi:IS30 family transposase [Nocardia cyriacigeorgica]|uniref:IS30 family transposase n=1 Tax=Nocardia cyriacigeorgica TaxID=135487 RepID=UPI001BB1FD99|nr:IS30 family transposase [Nocardia cyriacigeorgica]
MDACREVGINERTGKDWKAGIRRTSQGRVHADGTLRAYVGSDRYKQSVRKIEEPVPDDVAGSRYLSLAERLDIADGLRAGQSLTAIAVRIGRHKSTVSREVKRHGLEGLYLPYRAQRAAKTRRARPKASKLVTNDALRQVVADGLARFRSPEQISQRLHKDYPDDEGMRVSHETIYQALYCQARGGLKRELQTCLRTGRARRKPRRSPERRTRRFSNMVMISDRPAEVGDRAVPGHWEGDLIIGKGHQSAIGTLVERSTRYTMLVHLPGGSHHAEAVRDGLIRTISTLPTHLRGSLTWDQGAEMAAHHQFSMATDMTVYFCDPQSPWQRGSNENTNGLLRQYFPKGSDLSRFSPEDLEHVALQLNDRPRKTLGWDTPAERFRVLLTT